MQSREQGRGDAPAAGPLRTRDRSDLRMDAERRPEARGRVGLPRRMLDCPCETPRTLVAWADGRTLAIGRSVVDLETVMVVGSASRCDLALRGSNRPRVPGRRQDASVISEVHNAILRMCEAARSRRDMLWRRWAAQETGSRRGDVAGAIGRVEMAVGSQRFCEVCGIQPVETIVGQSGAERMWPPRLWPR